AHPAAATKRSMTKTRLWSHLPVGFAIADCALSSSVGAHGKANQGYPPFVVVDMDLSQDNPAKTFPNDGVAVYPDIFQFVFRPAQLNFPHERVDVTARLRRGLG